MEFNILTILVGILPGVLRLILRNLAKCINVLDFTTDFDLFDSLFQ